MERSLDRRAAPLGSAWRVSAAGAVVLVALVGFGCGGGSGNGPGVQPTPQSPIVSTITPTAGATTGGTLVTISGSNFVSGATVTIAGVAASNVRVLSDTSLTAVTGPREAGSGDVAITVGSRLGVLPGAFSYVNPGPANNPAPVIASLVARGSAPRQPPQFAEVGEQIDVVATVTDAETQADHLIYQWSATSGELTGTGRTVKWRAPSGGQGSLVSSLSLTVFERYIAPDGGLRENRVERSVTVNVHDSPREVGEMAVLFLTDFSTTSTPPQTVIRNFSTRCSGRRDELNDVEDNRRNFIINRYTIGEPRVSIAFGGVCSFRARAADACVRVPVRWEVTERATGRPNVAEGIDQVTAIYDRDRWYLCASDFDSPSNATLRFKK